MTNPQDNEPVKNMDPNLTCKRRFITISLPLYSGIDRCSGFRLGEMERDVIYMNDLIIPYWLFTL